MRGETALSRLLGAQLGTSALGSELSLNVRDKESKSFPKVMSFLLSSFSLKTENITDFTSDT